MNEAAPERCARCGPIRMSALQVEILPEIREFERTSTTALNAYLQPEVAGYFDRLESRADARAALVENS
jgi:N-methylhydantoinase A